MSQADEASDGHTQMLMASARVLVASSRLAREAARAARRHARDLLERIAARTQARECRLALATDEAATPWDRRSVGRRAHERLTHPGGA